KKGRNTGILWSFPRMIALKHTPTRLIDAAQRPQVVLAPVANRVWRARGLENAWRFTILFATLFWLWMTRRLTGRLAGVETRRTLEKLGGLWIKTGQLMALR